MKEVLKRWLGWTDNRQGKRESKCAACGNCCDLFGGNLRTSAADIARWRSLGRDDLLLRVSRLGWIWIDPETGRLEQRCPFLERTAPDAAHCTIHAIKPDMCRAYPTLAHGRRCMRGVFLKAAITLAGGLSFEAAPLLVECAWLV